MKLLLDEMLSPVIAARLSDRGHDVTAISGSEHGGLTDAAVLDLARAQGRAVVTNNVSDFRILHHTAIAPGGDGHFGVVFLPGSFRRSAADIGRIVDALAALLDTRRGPRDLANGEEWLTSPP